MALHFRPILFIDRSFLIDLVKAGTWKYFKKYFEKIRIADIHINFSINEPLFENSVFSYVDFDSHLGNRFIQDDVSLEVFLAMNRAPSIIFISDSTIIKRNDIEHRIVVLSSQIKNDWEIKISKPILNIRNANFLENGALNTNSLAVFLSNKFSRSKELNLIFIDKFLMERSPQGIRSLKRWSDIIGRNKQKFYFTLFIQKVINDDLSFVSESSISIVSNLTTSLSEELGLPKDRILVSYFPSTTPIQNPDLRSFIGNRYQLHDRVVYGSSFFLNATDGLSFGTMPNNSIMIAYKPLSANDLFAYTIEINVLIDVMKQRNNFSQEKINEHFQLD